MAQTQTPQEALLWALRDLEEKSFKLFKFHLWNRSLGEGKKLLARGELEGLSPADLASQLISLYGAWEAVKVVLSVLKVMNLLEPVEWLSHICLNGECSERQGELRPPPGLPQPHDISRDSHSL